MLFQHDEDDVSTKSFRRRKVISNWERYEEKDDTDSGKSLLRGADFGQLLQSSGNFIIIIIIRSIYLPRHHLKAHSKDVCNNSETKDLTHV